jgi:hypothetical protein
VRPVRIRKNPIDPACSSLTHLGAIMSRVADFRSYDVELAASDSHTQSREVARQFKARRQSWHQLRGFKLDWIVRVWSSRFGACMWADNYSCNSSRMLQIAQQKSSHGKVC